MPFDATKSAMVALGKFYLHRWDKHVLVDWAESMLARGYDSESMSALAGMAGNVREFQLECFEDVCEEYDIQLTLDEDVALEAYIMDLRDRVIAGEIEPAAAFAQIRPLAYDIKTIEVSGLDELDQDLNLIDSDQPAFYHEDLDENSREEVIRRFFRELRVHTQPFVPPGPPPAEGSRYPARSSTTK